MGARRARERFVRGGEGARESGGAAARWGMGRLRAVEKAVARGERGQRWKTAPTGGPHLSVRGREGVFFILGIFRNCK